MGTVVFSVSIKRYGPTLEQICKYLLCAPTAGRYGDPFFLSIHILMVYPDQTVKR